MSNDTSDGPRGEAATTLPEPIVEYEIGYKRPPKQSRFRPGQSGNPRGRPRGRKNLKTRHREMLDEPVTVTEGGKPKVMTKREYLLHSTYARAAKGQRGAANEFLNLCRAFGVLVSDPEDAPPTGVLVIPEAPATDEEWERRYGQMARGYFPPEQG